MSQFLVEFDGKSYNIQQFLRDHPGGVGTLIKYKEKNVSKAMQMFEHSASAYHMLKDFEKVENSALKDFNLTGKISKNGRIITEKESKRDVAEIEFLEELESRLDWSKPLLSQLDAIAPHYEKWVNSAVYRKCRLFANPVLESMTYTPWYIVPVFWIPIILYLGWTQYWEHIGCSDLCTTEPLTIVQFIVHLGIGMLIWTSLEYCLHRWVFHLDPGASLIWIKIHFLIHGLHHKMPFDGLRQVFPPVPAVLLATIVYMAFRLILSYSTIKLVGGLIGYLTYDMIHYYVHHGSPTDGTYLYSMKRYHSNHHFVNHDKAFGISSKIWDHVFKTFVHVKRLGFSLHW